MTTRGFDFLIPCRPRLLKCACVGDFDNRLFEPSGFIGEFPIDAHVGAFRQETSGRGCHFVVILYFGQAK